MRRIMLGLAAIAALLTTSALLVPEGEVVTLHTRDERGRELDTQLWIAAVDGREYLRSTGGRSRWLARARNAPTIELSRSRHALPIEEREVMRATVADDPAERAAANDAFARKYGVADRILGMLSRRESSVVLRLEHTAEPGGEPAEDAP